MIINGVRVQICRIMPTLVVGMQRHKRYHTFTELHEKEMGCIRLQMHLKTVLHRQQA
jgi:hypothetical protein